MCSHELDQVDVSEEVHRQMQTKMARCLFSWFVTCPFQGLLYDSSPKVKVDSKKAFVCMCEPLFALFIFSFELKEEAHACISYNKIDLLRVS